MKHLRLFIFIICTFSLMSSAYSSEIALPYSSEIVLPYSSEIVVEFFEGCDESVETIYEHTNSCGGYTAIIYIRNSGGICGNNLFQYIDNLSPCKDKEEPAGRI